jgi:predicted branched-subunit amino acid permease
MVYGLAVEAILSVLAQSTDPLFEIAAIGMLIGLLFLMVLTFSIPFIVPLCLIGLIYKKVKREISMILWVGYCVLSPIIYAFIFQKPIFEWLIFTYMHPFWIGLIIFWCIVGGWLVWSEKL